MIGVQGCMCKKYCRTNCSKSKGDGIDRQPFELRNAISSLSYLELSNRMKEYDEKGIWPRAMSLGVVSDIAG